MIKVLHLLSDYKFVEGHIYRFENADFDNTFVFIAGNGNYAGRYAAKLWQVNPFSPDFAALISAASSFDIVFVYNLDYLKSYIINRIDKKVTVIWYFYGTELYNALPAFKYSIYTNKTKSLIGINNFSVLSGRLKRIASIIKYKILGRLPTYTVIKRAMLRVNYFTMFSKEEYDHLQAHCTFRLPAFLPLPVYTGDMQKKVLPKNNNCLLLGHSATPDANHADIIDLFSGCGYAGKIIVPLSYGEDERYTRLIKQQLLRSGLHIEIAEDFIDRDAYSEKLNSCGAAVFNSYRQLALGNIFLSLRNNLKIYLNEHNPTYKWLLNKGVVIFSVQKNLEADIKNSRLLLLPGDAAKNTMIYEEMTDPQNNIDFLQHINEIGIQNKQRNS
jgi:dTDP-N-acetylfucosamine:lipid II N-acetylfucosaminyltransferase